ncbi:MAG: glycogen/starch synthase [Bacteroidales bacterium]|nr:glycogen/starch synthase [Bacteroidales bacterium]
MKINRVLFISQEIFPYLPESEIATISRDLPQGIQERGREIRTFMPKYGNINERRNQLHEVIRLSGMNLIIDDNDYPLIIKVASIQSARMQVYFIDNDDFFHRKNTVVDDDGTEFEDNDDRCIFFVRGVIETIRKLRWVPDVVHIHGWIAALAPLYIKRAFTDDPCFRDTKVVYSVYDNAFKQPFRPSFKEKLLIDGVSEADLVDFQGEVDFEALNKLAIRYSDGVIQASEGIDPHFVEHIESLGKPFLAYQNSDCYIDSYNDFYDQICG